MCKYAIGPAAGLRPPQRRVLLFLLLTLFGLGQPWQAAAQAAAAAATTSPPSIKVGFVDRLVPFVIDRNRGIFPDLLREALRRNGYELECFDFPSRQFDGDPLSQFAGLQLFVGTPRRHRHDYHYLKLYDFENVAVSLAKEGLKIGSVQDLRGKAVVAFNNAGVHLKQPFAALYERELRFSPNYREIENQRAQFEMLVRGRAQVILLDRSMARYYAAQFGLKNFEELVMHEIFPERNSAFLVGKNADLVARLGRSLAEMERDGTRRRLLEAYQ